MPSPKDPKRGTAWNKGVPMSEEQKIKLRKAKTGQKHTPETRAKMSAARTGKSIKRTNPPWNKGVPMTEEQKQKLSEGRKGRKASDETKAKMSTAQKARNMAAGGDALSPEARQKIGQSHKGTKHTPETRARMSASRHGRSSHMKGKTHPPETRAKLGQKSAARWKNMSEDERRSHLDRLHKYTENITNSWVEDAYALRLDAQDILYERQKRIGWYRVDFYIPADNRIIEVQGCYWHGCEQCQQRGKHIIDNYEKVREKDKKRHEYLRRKGYIVDLAWEHDLPRKP